MLAGKRNKWGNEKQPDGFRAYASWLHQLCVPWHQRLNQILEVYIGHLNTVSLLNSVITCGRVEICKGNRERSPRLSPAAVMLGAASKAAINHWKGKGVAHGLLGCLTAPGTSLYLEKVLLLLSGVWSP